MLIICAKGQAADINAVRQHALNNRLQITRRTALAHKHGQTAAQLLPRFVPADALVIRVNATGHIGRQLSAADAGRMTINHASGIMKKLQLLLHLSRVINNARHIHHLAHAQDARFVDKLRHILRIHHAAAVLKARRRHTAGQVYIIIQRHLSACLEHIADTCCSCNVRNLMRIRNQRRHAPAQLLSAVMLRRRH